MSALPTEQELGIAVATVGKILSTQNQSELGWIYSSTRNIKGYAGQVSLNRSIQNRVDNAIGGVSIVYIFALLETYIPRAVWKYAEPHHVERMYAYLHIRNTCAHGFDGSRAERYVDKFDAVMRSGKPILGIEHYDADVILLQPQVWQGLKDFIPVFLGSVLQKVINNGY